LASLPGSPVPRDAAGPTPTPARASLVACRTTRSVTLGASEDGEERGDAKRDLSCCHSTRLVAGYLVARTRNTHVCVASELLATCRTPRPSNELFVIFD
jgi:hypothetical protein